MLKILITRFWPVLLPLVIYLAWLALARRKAGKKGEKKPGFFDGPWWLPSLASLLLAVAAFIWLGLSAEPQKGKYIPSYQGADGEVIPGRFVPQAEPPHGEE